MKYKKCNNKLINSWKCSPIFSKQVGNKKYGLLISIFIAIIFLSIFVKTNINCNTPEERTKKYLENKYDDKFYNITLLKIVKNPDTDINFDGSSFGTIKKKGNTEYFKVHSSNEDIEFIVQYDTHEKKYNDNYIHNKNMKKYAVELYEKTKNTFKGYINKIEFKYNNNDNENQIIIKSKQDLNNILSKTINDNLDIYSYISLNMFINMDGFEFCKKEYEKIKEINDYLKIIQSTSELYSEISFSIITFNNIHIDFNKLNDVRIYDRYFNDLAWGETIEEFIKRETY